MASNILNIKHKYLLMNVMNQQNVNINKINKIFEFPKHGNKYSQLTNDRGPTITTFATNYNHIFDEYFSIKKMKYQKYINHNRPRWGADDEFSDTLQCYFTQELVDVVIMDQVFI